MTAAINATGAGIFFFQAEDGIRDKLVTGVQTCALPISEVGLADRAGEHHGELQADAPVAGMGVEIRLESLGEAQGDVAISCAPGPASRHLRAGQRAGLNISVAGPQVQQVEPALDPDMTVAGGSHKAPVEPGGINVAVTGGKMHLALYAGQRDVTVSSSDC